MKYAEVIEVHRQKSILHLARHFNIGIEQVQYMGEIDPSRGVSRFICNNHRETFGCIDHPAVFIAAHCVVELTKEFCHDDRELNRRTYCFVGQCPECGNVLMAEAKYNPL